MIADIAAMLPKQGMQAGFAALPAPADLREASAALNYEVGAGTFDWARILKILLTILSLLGK